MNSDDSVGMVPRVDDDREPGLDVVNHAASPFRPLIEEMQALKAELVVQRNLAERATQESLSLLYELRAMTRDVQKQFQAPSLGQYWELTDHVRDFVRTRTSLSDVLLVANGGDQDLQQLLGRRVVRFPEADIHGLIDLEDGRSAIAHFEALRTEGADFFLFPGPEAHWAEAVPQLWKHLCSEFPYEVNLHEDVVVFYLQEVSGGGVTRRLREVFATIEVFEFREERSPSLLEWGTNFLVSETSVFHCPIYSASDSQIRLSYRDKSIDFVLVASEDPARIAEAERVAKVAVLNLASSASQFYDLEDHTEVLVSLIIVSKNQSSDVLRCLQRIEETIPEGFTAEVIVVDDASTDWESDQIARWNDPSLGRIVIRNSEPTGRALCLTDAAKQARGKYLVVLDPSVVPMRGWLSALLRPFRMKPDVGVVAARVYRRDGSLNDLGGAIYEDGSIDHYGVGSPKANDAPLTQLFPVDFCATRAFAVERKLFQDLSGLDGSYSDQRLQDADFCFRLRRCGHEIYLQPECPVLDFDAIEVPPRRTPELERLRFVTLWKDALRTGSVAATTTTHNDSSER
jgi:GT2 family glycosyltransferase